MTIAASFKTFFKLSAADKDAGKTEKRADLEVKYEALTAMDVINASESEAPKLARILNESLESFAKRLIAAKKDDWSFCPAPEAITIDALYSELTATSTRGKRTLTKETLAAFAEFYAENAVEILGKTQKAAANGAAVIAAKLSPILANKSALSAFSGNLEALITSDKFTEDERAVEKYSDVAIALMEIITECLQVGEIGEDDI